MANELIYDGEEKLFICLDIGTTYCGASFAHLIPKQAPRNQVVQKFKGTKASKFPSVAWYDKNGAVRAIGAEAQTEHIKEKAEEHDWNYVQLFKLHLHPQKRLVTPGSPLKTVFKFLTHLGGKLSTSVVSTATSFEVPPLPNVQLGAIYSDFISYLIDSTMSYFVETTHDGAVVWDKLSTSAKLIIAHPNGWGIKEQAFLREAALNACRLSITSTDSHKRVSFCTEAEASLHFVLKHTESQDWLKPGLSFTVCDAGGSTVDITTYCVKEVSPRLRVEESTASSCTLAGSIFVNKAMEELLRTKVAGSKFSSDADIASMMAYFEQHTKPLFCGHDQNQSELISFGSHRDNDLDFGIRRGRLTVDQELLQEAFRGCIDIIISSLHSQVHRSNASSKCILLVGGFGESVYLRRKIKDVFEGIGIQVIAADEPAKKAVVEGLSLFSSKYLVSHRTSTSNFGHLSSEFRQIATIHADLSALRAYLLLKQGIGQKSYYNVQFEVGIKFGTTELEAFVIWNENGVEKRGPATILPTE
ncbi:hypothetical protein BT69DRAFT_1334601 [Atractiella rhizophila]|nr:hypothetical protein BT69DRAFT_1334601 [Atractiella rhizophila]